MAIRMNSLLRTLLLPAGFCLLLTSLAACNDGSETGGDAPTAETPRAPQVTVPAFNADSAYAYVKKQVDFGPRVPGTPAQKACADWMEARLKQSCDTVYRQETTVLAGDKKTKLPCINLIGVINPAAKKRVLLLAHWDSRPWADRDTKDRDKPILAADDGGSGVGVLLELARTIKGASISPDLGIDILLTDVEDWGKDNEENPAENWGEDSYGLGTQYWARNPHVAGYTARYGILLDMVGAANAFFPKEATSTGYAPDVQQHIWEAASRAGASSYFSFAEGGGVTDDHTFVNKLIHIPTVDIIHLPLNSSNAGFPAHWHTHNDNMSVIDVKTLRAVGQTLLQVLYEEAAPSA
jgi:glutaminyl-peptide cyclotransferase